jgi:hypothetical protein
MLRRRAAHNKQDFLLSIRMSIDSTSFGIAKVEERQITLSVNDLQISCPTSYFL